MPVVVSISELRNHHKKVFTMVEESPILLAQHSRSAAVLVSVKLWDQMVQRMEEMENYVLTQRRQQEMENGQFVTQADFEQEMAESEQ